MHIKSRTLYHTDCWGVVVGGLEVPFWGFHQPLSGRRLEVLILSTQNSSWAYHCCSESGMVP